MDEGFRSVIEMLITLEPHGIFGSNFAYLFQHCPATGMQNSNEALPSIILAGRGISLKMLITLEQHHIF